MRVLNGKPQLAFAGCLLALLAMDQPVIADEDATALCDRLAAFPYTKAAMTPGVVYEDINVERALPACRSAVADNPNMPRYQHQLARVLDRAGRSDEARQYYERAAQAGYALAEYSLAMSSLDQYYNDKTNIGALNRAHVLVLSAAEAGEPMAQYKLGHLLIRYTPIQDYDAANKWWRRAAEAGLPRALDAMSTAYLLGRWGVERDKDQAFAYAERFLATGDPQAYGQIGSFYYWGDGVEKDRRKALDYYQQGAALGDAKSHEKLARMYGQGEVVPQSDDKMVEHYEKAYAAGSRRAYGKLSEFYSRKRDYERAIHYGIGGAERGDADAVSNLTWIYCAQFCEEKDPWGGGVDLAGSLSDEERNQKAREAVAVLTRLANNGDSHAQLFLGVFYLDGLRGAIEIDRKTANAWLEKAAQQRHITAIQYLQHMYGMYMSAK